MARFNRSLRPVQSVKHIVDTNGGITGGTPSVTDVIVTRDTPAAATTNECAVGSTVHAIFLNVQVVPIIAAGGVNNIYMIVYKNPGSSIPAPNVDSVGTSDDRRRVLHQEMLMLGNGNIDTNISRTLFKGVVRLPRSIKRNGILDKLQVVVGHRAAEQTQSSDFCLECIYKEFR